VGAIGDGPPPGCVGCGGCALVCPTGHIEATRSPGSFAIWNREFPLAVCAVDPARCVACGACEEACPFSVPRVALRRDGTAAAEIRVDACRGCGVCVAACPSGAIAAPRARRAVPAPDGARLLVIGCPRSGLLDPTAPALPAAARAMELPCAGGVSPGMLLSALALGYHGVLVLGRHQETCRLDGAEDHAREVVSRIERLACLLGLGPGRARFTEPMPGREGPAAAARDALDDLGSVPPAETAPAEMAGDALAHAVELVFRMAKRGGREGLLPALDLLFEEWLDPVRFSERPGEPPRTAEEALGLLGGMLPGRRGAWRRSDR
jgi:ferredoxin